MSEGNRDSNKNSAEKRLPDVTPEGVSKKRQSAFEPFQSPLPSSNKTPKLSTDNPKKKGLDVSESPLCKDLFHQFQQVENGVKDSKEAYNLCSPQSQTKMAPNISPAQYDVFSDFQKDDFQLK